MANRLPEDFPSRHTYEQLLDLFVKPEIERRMREGLLEEPKVAAFQIVLTDEGTAPVVRLNEEVKAVITMRLAEPRKVAVGDPVYESDIGEIESIELADEDSPNCAHVTCLIRSGKVSVSFDFRYNKALATEHLRTAREFLDGARDALAVGRMALFVDNLLSASELSARATLLTTPDKKFKKRATHKAIQQRYEQFVGMGNASAEHARVYAELRRVRDAMRYVTADPRLSLIDSWSYLETVESMYQDAVRRLS